MKKASDNCRRSRHRVKIALAAGAVMILLGLPTVAAAEERAAVDYATDIAPILQTYCVGCHSPDDTNGELMLDSFASLMRGGEHGAAVTPGAAETSRLWMMAAGRLEPKMPPDDMEGPNEEQLELLARWINDGAPGPATDEPLIPILRTPTIASQVDAQSYPVTSVAISPDNRIMAVARFATVELLDPQTQQVIRAIGDQPGKVTDLRFNHDGSRLMIASGVTGLYGTATMVRVADGQVELTIRGHRDVLYAAALSPDGRTIATAGYDRDIRLWDAATGEQRNILTGHNGAIFDLAFSADGAVLATASADETVKLWRVEDGVRLDTLSQPQGEVWTVAFTPDGQSIVAGSADNRFRVWKFESRTEPRINTLVETRFADESPLVRLAFTPDGQRMIIASQSGRLGVFDTQSWSKIGALPSADDVITGIAITSAGDRAYVATMGGRLRDIELNPTAAPHPVSLDQQASDAPSAVASSPAVAVAQVDAKPMDVYLQLDSITDVTEPADQQHQTPAAAIPLPRGATVTGTVAQDDSDGAEDDWYRFDARRGEVWMVETRAARDGSPLDTIIEIRDAQGQPIPRARLQAVRDSYFTFRGKDSTQSNDFRLFAWEEMELNDLLYSAGEVTRLWMYPRGPDSGFNVYPGTGARHTYFDTSPITHALHEPAYIVRPLGADDPPVANGLPMFTIFHVNDDDAARQIGTDSRLRFTAPADGTYTIRISDTRNQGGDQYKYRLSVRPASPDYTASVSKIAKPIPAGAGREFQVRVERVDGFDGPITFEVRGLPDGLHATETIVIEAGQQEAYGVIWADAGTAPDQTFAPPSVIARAEILGRTVEHAAGDLGELKTAPRPPVTLAIEAEKTGGASTVGGESSGPLLAVHAGETVSAVVRVDRQGHEGEIQLGNEFAGRNLPHGVFVDNIGLNGLMVLKGEDRQQFFITAAPIAAPGVRLFHLKAELDGGISSPPIPIEILPPRTQ